MTHWTIEPIHPRLALSRIIYEGPQYKEWTEWQEYDIQEIRWQFY